MCQVCAPHLEDFTIVCDMPINNMAVSHIDVLKLKIKKNMTSLKRKIKKNGSKFNFIFVLTSCLDSYLDIF